MSTDFIHYDKYLSKTEIEQHKFNQVNEKNQNALLVYGIKLQI